MPINYMSGDYAGLEAQAGELGTARAQAELSSEDRRQARQQNMLKFQNDLARLPAQQKAKQQYEFVMALNPETVDNAFGVNDETDPQGHVRGFIRHTQLWLKNHGPEAAPVIFDDFHTQLLSNISGTVTQKARLQAQTEMAAQKEKNVEDRQAHKEQGDLYEKQWQALEKHRDTQQAKLDKVNERLTTLENTADDPTNNVATAAAVIMANAQKRADIVALKAKRGELQRVAESASKAAEAGLARHMKFMGIAEEPAAQPGGATTRPAGGGKKGPIPDDKAAQLMRAMFNWQPGQPVTEEMKVKARAQAKAEGYD